MKQYRCEECGIILKWPEVRVVEDGDHTEHRVCIYCAEEKVFRRGVGYGI